VSKRSKRAFRELSPGKQPAVQGFGAPQVLMPMNAILYKMANRLPPTERATDNVERDCRGRKVYANRTFTDEQVRELRRRHQSGEWPSKLAAEYGLKTESMRRILLGVNYSWVI
jgi:hypothetical protein